MSREALEAAFRATRYVVMLPDGELALAIGVRDPDGERRLVASLNLRRRWDLLTPCNPQARAAPPTTNRVRLAAFHADLRAWGGTWQPSLTRHPRWEEEPGALLVDAEPGWVRRLAAKYEQAAYVAAERGDAPALVWLR